MKTKVCSRCRKTKPTTSFNRKRSTGTSGKYQPYCRPCQSEYQKQHYKKRTRQQLQQMYKNRRRRKQEIYEFLTDYFEKNTCVDCAKKKVRIKKLLRGKVPTSTIERIIKIMDSDIRTLTFDHLHTRGKKEHTIADMIRDIQPLHRIEKEIQKCVVRCHNCHDIITVKRARNWRYHAHKQLK
jgi:hypothetical protein